MATANDHPVEHRVSRLQSRTLAVGAIGTCLAVALFMLATRGRFQGMFDDFELDLPVVSQLVLTWSLSAFLGSVTVLAIIKELLPVNRLVRDAGNTIVLLIALSCLAVYVLGIALPMMALIQGLS